ncbi:MAG: formimidoylglutamase [Bacteroidia bacterium]|nr:formimidoylglutamase [Bacteroidia bacterium]MBT8269084.1 formimidoylglutamase [Bacteroidia bacterium]NNF81718.1 formimidoylglutamase [Flavobacteriaceae bacterium]NNK69840.1 formimidoylglutamase [Flavobacteriaceae bacterium]NNL79224.1 formimidoylglutamase [Flavobacteriaceae bacterium]
MSKLNILKTNPFLSSKNSSSKPLRLGERVKFLSDSTPIYDQLKDLDVDYVIFGIPEDVGAFANNGKRGGRDAWKLVLKELLNLRVNSFIKPQRLVILGLLDFSEEQTATEKLDPSKKNDLKKARQLVAKMDKQISQLIHDIIKAGKKPIVVGGGHNNAYGILKGTSLALKQSLNVINFDAHTDFEHPDGRHNGNAFSYAYNDGFLDRYFIYGLHENYLPNELLKTIKKLPKRIQFNTIEDIYVRRKVTMRKEIDRALSFIGKGKFGIEVDCDSIENMPAVAMTTSGLRANHMREMIYKLSRHENVHYLHICGFAPELCSKRMRRSWTKFVAYMISDFVRDR